MTTRREFMEAGAGAFLLCLQKFSILSMVPPDIEESSDTSSSSYPSSGDGYIAPCPHCGKRTGLGAGQFRAIEYKVVGGHWRCMNCDHPRATFAGLSTEAEVSRKKAAAEFHAGRTDNWISASEFLDQINKTR